MNNEITKQTNRRGDTITTSVSVSKKFSEMMEEYDISPTEAFRKGIAVTLYDLGVSMYQSEKNKERQKYVQEFLKKIEKDEKLQNQYEKIEKFEELKKHFDKLKNLIKEIEGGEKENDI